MERLEKARSPRAHREGFTLLELIVVISIVAILLALIAPAAFTISRANALSSQGDEIYNQLVAARQTALSENRTVGVRLYDTEDPTSTDIAPRTRLLVIAGTDNTGAPEMLVPPTRLQENIVISSAPGLSSLTDPTSTGQATGTNTDGLLPDEPTAAPYAGFDFYPNGTTSLPDTADGTTETWHLTLTSALDDTASIASGAPPKNYYTIKIDPRSGALTRYRP